MKIVMAKTAVDMLRVSETQPTGLVVEQRVYGEPGRVAPQLGNQPGVGNAPSGAMQAAKNTIALFAKRTQATAGLILLDRNGNPGFAFNTPRMAYGYVAPDASFVTAV
jgi:hypothetical protein